MNFELSFYGLRAAGISPDRMLVTLRSDNSSTITSSTNLAHTLPLDQAISALTAFGVDYRIWLGGRSVENAFHASLLAVQHVPLKDWIVVVEGHEFLDFGAGATALQYLQQREREVGYNYLFNFGKKERKKKKGNCSAQNSSVLIILSISINKLFASYNRKTIYYTFFRVQIGFLLRLSMQCRHLDFLNQSPPYRQNH